MLGSIYVELTSYCNMSCDFCTYSTNVRKKQHMDFELFKKIIDEIHEYKLGHSIELAALGESFLYPQLLEAVAYCKSKGLPTSIITNGILLNNELYDKLNNLGLTQLIISFHNTSELSFKYRHAPSSITYSDYRKHILQLINHHLESESSINVALTLMFFSRDWLNKLVWDMPEYAVETDAAGFLLTNFLDELYDLPAANNLQWQISASTMEETVRNLENYTWKPFRLANNFTLSIVSLNPHLFQLRKKLGSGCLTKIKLKRKKRAQCVSRNTIMILSNGALIPCCRDGLEELVMVKVTMETSIRSVLEGNEYRMLMEAFDNNIAIHTACQECLGETVLTSE